jgi:putative isomerase
VVPVQLHLFPFSRRGSWINLYRKAPGARYGGDEAAPLQLRVAAGILWENQDVFTLDLEREGRAAPWTEDVAPGMLTLRETGNRGEVQIAFQDENTLRLRTESVTLSLTLRQGKPLRFDGNRWAVRASSCGWLLISTTAGELTVDESGCFRLRPDSELSVHFTSSAGTVPRAHGSLADCAATAEVDLDSWRTNFTAVPREFSGLCQRELWNLWNLVVRPHGNFRRETVLVSKAYLAGLWSWDHCWHALGIAAVAPELSWNCFMAMFDHQDEAGALPDVMSANQLFWGVLKPPVHGWLLGLLEERHSWFGDSHRREIYPALARMTRFWLRERTAGHDGPPGYLDGCDSGWDNATVFDHGFPIQTPDLATWLILQQDWLSKTARHLGLEAEAEEWTAGSRSMLAALLEHFWTGDRFVARLGDTHEPVASESLLLRVPLLLGDRLPKAARDWCASGLLPGGKYRTPFGLLTEPKDSPHFDGDGSRSSWSSSAPPAAASRPRCA